MEADEFVLNFNSDAPLKTVPAGRLIILSFPLRMVTVPLALSPTVFVPVVDFVLSLETSVFTTSAGRIEFSKSALVSPVSRVTWVFSSIPLEET